ncbi:MAG: energy transducer TonB [Bacteroidetes bacterium]|nr:MAG: energy transducer TonB [Bacteroidota bacterium]
MNPLIIILIACIVAAGCASSAVVKKETLETTKSTPQQYTYIDTTSDEIPTHYPGGDAARIEFINNNLVYPENAKKNSLMGTVYVTFIVETDSSTSNIVVTKTFDEECGKEAARVVSLMKWVPGKQKGNKVRVRISMPIKFRL